MDRRTAEGSPGLRFLKMHGLGNDFVPGGFGSPSRQSAILPLPSLAWKA